MPDQLPIVTLRQILNYDPSSGRLFWKTRDRGLFKAHRDYVTFNAQHAGQEAFTASTKAGYRTGKIFGQEYRAHRVAWAIHYGAWPLDQVDHINGITTDNRIENLREVSQLENNRNQKRYSTNKSGVTGVSWDSKSQKWLSQISISGTILTLGRFTSISDATVARKSAEAEHGFHENHGR